MAEDCTGEIPVGPVKAKASSSKWAAESKYPWDYLKLVQTIPADEAFRPLDEGGCPLVSTR